MGIPLAGAVAIGRGVALHQQGKAEKAALELQRTQQRIAAEVQSLRALDKLKDVISLGNAMGAARGIDPSSPTLLALQRANFDEFAKDEEARMLNADFKDSALRQQEINVSNTLKVAQVGNLFDFVKNAQEVVPISTLTDYYRG